jgi:predicted polyphosphate/ATP-dependent NAD kinase
MGGRVGLRGPTAKRSRQALALGASRGTQPVVEAPQLGGIQGDIEILTVSGEMGERSCAPAVRAHRALLDQQRQDDRRATRGRRASSRRRVDLILSPAATGLRATSAPWSATTSSARRAGRLQDPPASTASTRATPASWRRLSRAAARRSQAEVMDIAEEAFRQGRVTAELFGYLTVPADENRVQGGKAGRAQSEENALDAIAYHVMDNLIPGCLYILGTGSTLFGIKQRLGFEGTLLGVDAMRDGELVAADVTEQQLLDLLGPEGSTEARIVVTVIGGQGYIFGRGNQQLSPRVIERVGRENIIVVATKGKLAALRGRPLLVDTGKEETNEAVWHAVIVGYHEQMAVRVSA